MKASVHSIRIAPKKANLIAKMVRGMPVPDAVEALRRTHKKAARIVEDLLRSAIANASHNDKQDPQTMVIKTIVVNQGQAYRRGMPKARGQVRPYRKFLSHIDIVLGYVDVELETGKSQKKQKSQKSEVKGEQSASQKEKNEVKKVSSPEKKKTASTKKSSESSASSASSAS